MERYFVEDFRESGLRRSSRADRFIKRIGDAALPSTLILKNIFGVHHRPFMECGGNATALGLRRKAKSLLLLRSVRSKAPALPPHSKECLPH